MLLWLLIALTSESIDTYGQVRGIGARAFAARARARCLGHYSAPWIGSRLRRIGIEVCPRPARQALVSGINRTRRRGCWGDASQRRGRMFEGTNQSFVVCHERRALLELLHRRRKSGSVFFQELMIGFQFFRVWWSGRSFFSPFLARPSEKIRKNPKLFAAQRGLGVGWAVCGNW